MRNEHKENEIITAHVPLKVIESADRHWLGAEWPTQQGTFHYDPSEPYAVALLCHIESEQSCRTFGRDLLAAGMVTAAGEGDVRVRPALASGTLRLELMSSDGTLVVDAQATDVVDFLQLTFDAVPTGSESERLDLDQELANLTG